MLANMLELATYLHYQIFCEVAIMFLLDQKISWVSLTGDYTMK